MVTMRKLQNGVRVVLEEIPYVRSISFGIWVKNGTRNESQELNGISHYIEHMMFKGTKNRTAKEIAEEMDAVGGQINAYTTKEYTCYHTRVLDSHFQQALDVMSDMFLNSLFSEKEITKERNVIAEEIAMYEDAPEELVHDALQEEIWKGSSLGMPILGTMETISNINQEAILKFLRDNYHTENTVLSVAGNFKEADILETLDSALGGWESTKPYQPSDTKTIYTPSLVLRDKDIEQVHICLAFPGLRRDHPKKYALAVFNTIFGGGMSSILFQKIREEYGYTYSIYSYTSAYNDEGLFGIYGGMNPNQTEEVLNLVFQEIKNLKKESISAKMIDVTKEQIKSNFIIGTESTANRMTSSGAAALLRNAVQDTEEILQQIDAVTVEDMEELAELLFQKDKMSLCAVGNIEKIPLAKIYSEADF